MSGKMRRNVITGSLAGLLGGVAFAGAMALQAPGVPKVGLLGVHLDSAVGLFFHLGLSLLVGAGFGAMFQYHARGYAILINSGILYGFVWWMIGPMTAYPLLMGHASIWTLGQAGELFPSLLGHLFFGGVTGLAFYALVTLWLWRWPEPQRPPLPEPIHRVVILGGGFGGVYAAKRLEELFPRHPEVDVMLVSDSNYLLFTPMLAEVASSALEAQHISAPVRATLPNTRFRNATITAIDTDAQTINIQPKGSASPETCPYDHLIVGLGAIPAYHGLPGLQAHALSLKSLADAVRLRDHAITALEQAEIVADEAKRRRLLTFVSVGGGFAGVETVAELFDLVHSVRRYYPSIEPAELRFVLVHSRDHILPELSPALGRYAQEKLEQRGIEFALGRRAAKADGHSLWLDDGTELPAGTLVWAAGNQPHPLVAGLPCQHNRGGGVVCDETLKVQGLDNVWGVGDCAEIPDPANPDRPCPPTAQHAVRQGKTAAENVAALLRDRPDRVKPFSYKSQGKLVVLGRHTAAAEVFGLKFSGLLAWLMWRTIYWGKLPTLEKKVRVMLDWILELFFPRDIVLTWQLEEPPPQAEPPPRADAPEEVER